MSLHALENVGVSGDGHEDHAHQTVSLQYENIEQQNESYIVGMWSFLVTEVMFFGALFLLYSLYRVLYFNAYLEAHQFLDVRWGTINTMVLLLSSWSMVLAVYNGQKGKRGRVLAWLTVVQLCAAGFMGIKSIEYAKKFHEGLFPNARFDYAKALTMHHEEAKKSGEVHEAASPRHEMAWKALEAAEAEKKSGTAEVSFKKPVAIAALAGTPVAGQVQEALPSAAWGKFETEQNKARIFFSIYFTMTGLHGVHVIVGMLLMGALMYFYGVKHHCVEDYIPLELIGLYWHFVDIVWIFLFPLMYPIS
jgi:cytochrome c oxidase subunit III